MKPSSVPLAAPAEPLLPRLFAVLFGAFFGLCLLKFGNPPIMEKFVAKPENIFEFLFGYPWPIAWAYALLGLVGLVGLLAARPNLNAPRWLLALPLAWLIWQALAATRSLDGQLTQGTLAHFAACAGCFYLGLFSLSRMARLRLFWAGLLCGFLLVLAVGLDQHFGGFAQYRRYFYEQLYLYPGQDVPPEFMKKVASDRIFSTLFYPNALAGGLLLLLPSTLFAIRQWRQYLATAPKPAVLATVSGLVLAAAWLYVSGSKVGLAWLALLALGVMLPVPAGLFVVLLGLAALGCLYWSGSKGGWLLMLVLGLLALRRAPLRKPYEITVVACILAVGLAGFAWKYSGFFQKGATSVSARFDYWRATAQTAWEMPIFGSGPGTFYLAYQRIKRPESESSRLVHNDYLQQASDSGLPGFLIYTMFIVGALVYGRPREEVQSRTPNARRVESKVQSPKSKVLEAPGGEGRVPSERSQPGEAPSPSASRLADPVPPEAFWVWLGLLGWALQGFLEFGLYLPALAWPAFAMLGWLLGQPRKSESNNQETKQQILGAA